jgi:tetratricopeptide (TPR) repeat protein
VIAFTVPAMTTLDTARALFADARYAEAAETCRFLLIRRPDAPGVLGLLGQSLIAGGRTVEGIAMIAAEPRPHAAMLVTLSDALLRVGLASAAEARARDARALSPDDADAKAALARAREAQGKSEDEYAAAGSADPPSPRDLAAAQDRLTEGNAHLAAERLDAAADSYRAALAAVPHFAAALGNLGTVLTAQGRLDAALAAYREALALEPDNADTGFAYSLALLLAGDLAEGRRWYECRRRVGVLRWNYDRYGALPQWRDGVDLTGRRVLLLAEQGRGDMIQYARFAPLLARHASRVVLELPNPLHGLFEGMPGIARLIDRDAPAPDCDITCPLLSLPRALGLAPETLPPPYIADRADLRAQWDAWLGDPDGGRRIGLVIAGDPRHPHDARRSIPLDLFRPILDLPDQFVLVQTELRDADRAERETMDGRLRFPGAALTDFADTAALLANLDLLITVDTAVAHLAGCLGRPVWLLLAHAPDHRWMLDRPDSPWYPSMRLFRQPAPGDWRSVMAAVQAALQRP